MEPENSEGGPSGEKRKRKQKFSERELETLTEEMACNHELLFGKQAKNVPEVRKRKIWLEIQEKVNAVGVIPRSIDELKKRWYDMRLRSKEKLAERIKEASKTGGGTSHVDQPTPHEELVEATILHESVSGVTNIDSSEPRNEEEEHVEHAIDDFDDHPAHAHDVAPGEGNHNEDEESIPIVRSKRRAVAPFQPFEDSDKEPEGSRHSAHETLHEDEHVVNRNAASSRRAYSLNNARHNRGDVTDHSTVFQGLEQNMLKVQEKQHKALRSIYRQLCNLNKSNASMGDGMRRMADPMDRLCVAMEKSEGNRVRAARRQDSRMLTYCTAINRLCTVTAQCSKRSISMQRMVSECTRNVAKGLDKVFNAVELLQTSNTGARGFYEPMETEDTGSRSSSNPTPTSDTSDRRSGRHATKPASVRSSGAGQRTSSMQRKK